PDGERIFDLLFRRKKAAFQLNRPVPESSAHFPRLIDQIRGINSLCLAGCIPTGGSWVGLVTPCSSGSFKFVKEVCGKGHFFAHSATQQIRNPAIQFLTHNNKAGDFKRTENMYNYPLIP